MLIYDEWGLVRWGLGGLRPVEVRCGMIRYVEVS